MKTGCRVCVHCASGTRYVRGHRLSNVLNRKPGCLAQCAEMDGSQDSTPQRIACPAAITWAAPCTVNPDLRHTRFLWRRISREEAKSANTAGTQILHRKQAWTAHSDQKISPTCLGRAMQRSPHLKLTPKNFPTGKADEAQTVLSL
jgi:hypothetical protein